MSSQMYNQRSIARENRVATFRSLLSVMAQPRAFYVLGAGASFGLLPTTPQMRAGIKAQYLATGIYTALRSASNPLFDRIVESGSPKTFDADEYVYQNISAGVLTLLVQQQLWSSAFEIVPPHYAVFDVVGSPATIFSFNLDGLAVRFCGSRHIVVEPHGRIDHWWFEDDDRYQSVLNQVTSNDFIPPLLTRKHLPSCEPPAIVETMQYRGARRLISAAPAIVVVGYSFGTFNGVRDDSESWEFFVDMLKRCPVHILILDPDAERLAELLRQAVRSNRVAGMTVRWEQLATVLLKMACPQGIITDRLSDCEMRALLYAYDKEVDSK